MDAARKIVSGDELRALAAAGTGFIIDPFTGVGTMRRARTSLQ